MLRPKFPSKKIFLSFLLCLISCKMWWNVSFLFFFPYGKSMLFRVMYFVVEWRKIGDNDRIEGNERGMKFTFEYLFYGKWGNCKVKLPLILILEVCEQIWGIYQEWPVQKYNNSSHKFRDLYQKSYIDFITPKRTQSQKKWKKCLS